MPGPNAIRYDNDIQQAFYQGWKSVHGVKFQLIVFPNGMIGDISELESAKSNDLFTLNMSNINNRMAAAQIDNNIQYCALGDSAYHVLSHITPRIHGFFNNIIL